MFGDWRWGERVAGARNGFLFFFVRMLPRRHGRSGGRLLASTDDDKRGCWLVCSAHRYAAHWGSPGDAVSRQLVQTLMLLLALGLQWQWDTLPLMTQGHTDDTAVTHLQWKCDDFSLWLMCGPMAWLSWTAGGQIALHAFEMEVMILQLSAWAKCLYWTDLNVT